MSKHKKQKTSSSGEISWQALDMAPKNRSPFWYMVFAILSAGAIIFALFYDGSVLTLITFILMISVIVLFSFHPPKKINHEINPEGIIVGENFYPYSIIRKFWIEYQPPHTKTLNFETSTYLNNKIIVQLGDQNPVDVKMMLSEYLVEDLEHQYSLREILAKRLKI